MNGTNILLAGILVIEFCNMCILSNIYSNTKK